MASLDELANAIQADIEQANQTTSSMQGSASQAEQVGGQFQALNAESMAAGAHQVKQMIEEAQQAQQAVVSKLEAARNQAQSLKS